MSWFIVDVEADGPYPGEYSMFQLGVVRLDLVLQTTFHGKLAPISALYKPEPYALSGTSREEVLTYDDPHEVIRKFHAWVAANNVGERPIFVSDNPAFDWQFVNYYLWTMVGENIFGWSARRIGDLYCGMMGDTRKRWKQLRTTVHDHNPVNDARGNAEALLKMADMGLKITL